METKRKFKTVMLIDDNEIDNLINQKMIEAAGICENIFIHSGAKSAIEFLRNIEKLNEIAHFVLPEVIFLDIDMPLMDGFQFLDQFNKMGNHVKNNCKVVILTSSINPQDANKSKGYKYVKRYINKPLTQDTLLALEV